MQACGGNERNLTPVSLLALAPIQAEYDGGPIMKPLRTSASARIPTAAERAAKLAQRVDHFTTLLLLVHAQALFLRPMLRNVELVARMGTTGRRAGFEQLRLTLYRTVILELMKLCGDRDQRTASLPALIAELRNPEVRRELLRKYSRPGWPRAKGDTYAMWRSESKRERAELKRRFRDRYRRLRANFSALKRSREFKAFRKIRNRLLAHYQVVTPQGAIRLFDPGSLKLKVGDENRLLALVREIAVDLNSVVRGASFSWEAYLEAETRDVCAFWEIESLDGPGAG